MGFELPLTDREITALRGRGLMKRMLDHLDFDRALRAGGLPEPGTGGPRSRLSYGRENRSAIPKPRIIR